MSERKSGFLVLADISGFTEVLTSTELEHGPWIITELLEEVIRRIAPPLEIHAIEGDAVFALGPDGKVLPPAALLAILREGLAGFRSKQRELAADEGCGCRCCRGIDKLRLKAIGHYGPFLEHTIGGRAQITGPDVILAHRMLKNGVTTRPTTPCSRGRRSTTWRSIRPTSGSRRTPNGTSTSATSNATSTTAPLRLEDHGQSNVVSAGYC